MTAKIRTFWRQKNRPCFFPASVTLKQPWEDTKHVIEDGLRQIITAKTTAAEIEKNIGAWWKDCKNTIQENGVYQGACFAYKHFTVLGIQSSINECVNKVDAEFKAQIANTPYGQFCNAKITSVKNFMKNIRPR